MPSTTCTRRECPAACALGLESLGSSLGIERHHTHRKCSVTLNWLVATVVLPREVYLVGTTLRKYCSSDRQQHIIYTLGLRRANCLKKYHLEDLGPALLLNPRPRDASHLEDPGASHLLGIRGLLGDRPIQRVVHACGREGGRAGRAGGEGGDQNRSEREPCFLPLAHLPASAPHLGVAPHRPGSPG